MTKISTVFKLLLPSLIPITQLALAASSAAQNVDQVAQREVERRQAAMPRGGQVHGSGIDPARSFGRALRSELPSRRGAARADAKAWAIQPNDGPEIHRE